jgi:hypothetical protein
VRGGDSGGQHLNGKDCPKSGRDLWRREIVAAGRHAYPYDSKDSGEVKDALLPFDPSAGGLSG